MSGDILDVSTRRKEKCCWHLVSRNQRCSPPLQYTRQPHNREWSSSNVSIAMAEEAQRRGCTFKCTALCFTTSHGLEVFLWLQIGPILYTDRAFSVWPSAFSEAIENLTPFVVVLMTLALCEFLLRGFYVLDLSLRDAIVSYPSFPSFPGPWLSVSPLREGHWNWSSWLLGDTKCH